MQQYVKIDGVTVDPKVAVAETNAVFMRSPISASLSGLWPRTIGVLLKFGFLLGYSFIMGQGEPGFAAATVASILSAPFINPVRMVEKQQRAFMKTTGAEKPLMEIFREAAAKNFMPLFRGTIPLMGHSFASAVLGLVGQPKLQKYARPASFVLPFVEISVARPVTRAPDLSRLARGRRSRAGTLARSSAPADGVAPRRRPRSRRRRGCRADRPR